MVEFDSSSVIGHYLSERGFQPIGSLGEIRDRDWIAMLRNER